MTDLTTTHLKRLLYQATPGPWTVEDDGYDIIVGNAEGHRMIWGDQVRFKFEAGDKKHDPQLAAHAPELAEEVIRLRGEIEDLITAMQDKAAIGESQSPAVIAGYLKEIVLGETND
nr:MAG TPA: Ead/Ea22-like protein [Caudoviricetes sp.]